MKATIHPTNYAATVTCACGNSFATISTKEVISTEICSNCHPFFTGKQHIIDSAHRVEKYQAKKQKQSELSTSRKHLSKTQKLKAKSEGKKVAKTSAKDALKAAKAALSGL